MSFSLRWGLPATTAVWLVWLALGSALAWEPIWFHVDYFSSPGPQFRPAILALLPLLLAFALGYQAVRTERVRRLELPALALAVGAVALLKEPLAAPVALLMLLSSYAAARPLHRFLDDKPPEGLSAAALLCVLGLAGWQVLLSALGVAGLLRPWVFALLLAAPLAVRPSAALELGRIARSIHRTWSTDVDLSSPLTAVSVVFGAVFVLPAMAVALAPSIAYDSLAMHLPAVFHYLAVERLEPVPGLAYSYYPQGYELLLTLAAGLAGQPAAQLISLSLFGLAAAVAYAIARELDASRGAACLGVFLASTIPFLHWTGSVAKNDMALVSFQLCALLCLLRLRRAPRMALFGLGAFFLGASFGVKHVALFGGLPLGLLYLWHLKRLAKPWATLALMAALFALPAAFWLGRAFVETGNPVYPSRTAKAVRALPSIMGKRYPKPTRWAQYPWVSHFEGRGVFESPTNNPYGFALLLVLPAWLLVRRRRADADEGVCLLYLAVYYGFWTYVWGVGRYGLPLIFVFAAVSAPRVWALHAAGGQALRWSLQAGVAGTAAFAMLVTLILEVNLPQLRYFAGSIDKPSYLREVLLGYESLERLGDFVGPNDRVFGLDNCARAYAPYPGQYTCVGVPSWMAQRAPEVVANAMRGERFDFVALPPTKKGAAVLERLEQEWRVEPLLQDEATRLYRVLAPAQTVAPEEK